MEKISAPLSKLLLFSPSVPETGGKFSSNIPYKNSTRGGEEKNVYKV